MAQVLNSQFYMLLDSTDREIKLDGYLHIAHMLVSAHHENRPALWRKRVDLSFDDIAGLSKIQPFLDSRTLYT